MAHLITGYAGNEHIKSSDQGSFNASFFGAGQFVMESGNKFAGSIVNNNTVRIADGDLLMKGRHIRIEPNTYEDMTIETGTSGTNRIDLIVMTYEKTAETGIETAYLEVVKGTAVSGTPTEPTVIDGDILSGAIKNQMPLYAVTINGVVLSSIKQKFTVCPTYKTLAEQYAQQFETNCNSVIDGLFEVVEYPTSGELKAYSQNGIYFAGGGGRIDIDRQGYKPLGIVGTMTSNNYLSTNAELTVGDNGTNYINYTYGYVHAGIIEIQYSLKFMVLYAKIVDVE